MSSPDDFWKRVSAALGVRDARKSPHLNWKWDTAPEAKLHLAKIRQLQKELRLIKKDVGTTVKQVHSSFTAQKANVGRGVGAAVLGGILGKKALGSSNAAHKENLRRQEQNTEAPYHAVSRSIDQVLLQLDEVKIQIDTWLAKHQAS